MLQKSFVSGTVSGVPILFLILKVSGMLSGAPKHRFSGVKRVDRSCPRKVILWTCGQLEANQSGVELPYHLHPVLRAQQITYKQHRTPDKMNVSNGILMGRTHEILDQIPRAIFGLLIGVRCESSETNTLNFGLQYQPSGEAV